MGHRDASVPFSYLDDRQQPVGYSMDLCLWVVEAVKEALVYDFSTELHEHRAVSDGAFERARARFGEQGVVDLLGINGYYTLLAMVMNGACTAPPDSDAPPLKQLPER